MEFCVNVKIVVICSLSRKSNIYLQPRKGLYVLLFGTEIEKFRFELHYVYCLGGGISKISWCQENLKFRFMKKIVKNVLGFVSLLLVLPFVIPAGLMVLAAMFVAQQLIKVVGGCQGNGKSEETRFEDSNKWNNVSDSLSWNCLNIWFLRSKFYWCLQNEQQMWTTH